MNFRLDNALTQDTFSFWHATVTNEEKKIPNASHDALVRAAKDLFAEKGYGAVSTRELAEAANVNLGAIQYHFGSKAALFVETIRQLMTEKRQRNPLFSSSPKLENVEDAATELCIFIRAFLSDVCHPQGPDACRLMYREILGSTTEDPELHEALVSSVVDEFIRPVDDHLAAILRILAPEASKRDSAFLVHSIIGQCIFYITNRIFMERLRQTDFTAAPVLNNVANHIATFTLRGLGLRESVISAALQRAKDFQGKHI